MNVVYVLVSDRQTTLSKRSQLVLSLRAEDISHSSKSQGVSTRMGMRKEEESPARMMEVGRLENLSPGP
jgi:hypothetical protein